MSDALKKLEEIEISDHEWIGFHWTPTEMNGPNDSKRFSVRNRFHHLFRRDCRVENLQDSISDQRLV
jgi:hypothetical protein